MTTIDAEPMSHEARDELQTLTREQKAERQRARAAARELDPTTLSDDELSERLNAALNNPDRTA